MAPSDDSKAPTASAVAMVSASPLSKKSAEPMTIDAAPFDFQEARPEGRFRDNYSSFLGVCHISLLHACLRLESASPSVVLSTTLKAVMSDSIFISNVRREGLIYFFITFSIFVSWVRELYFTITFLPPTMYTPPGRPLSVLPTRTPLKE